LEFIAMNGDVMWINHLDLLPGKWAHEVRSHV
jgi:hypothetical protein